ncbi:hypothetical protein O181_030643 [Austropuccinia psidii MF-1]|uniref:Uncharacterized protein n=1 Tax=Austropuccinia psidii MF-1 TaxID=1389203 RepID=A0A9Q3H3V8_9BASI|nr:hypothetical protein [Austropuccinia psidii MF-1]
MASIDGQYEHEAFNSRIEEKQPSTTQNSAKPNPSGQQQKFQFEKAAKSLEQRKRKSTIHKTMQPGLWNPKYSTGCHGKCVSDGQINYGNAEEREEDRSKYHKLFLRFWM